MNVVINYYLLAKSNVCCNTHGHSVGRCDKKALEGNVYVYIAVSYTHLDVYKRQTYCIRKKFNQFTKRYFNNVYFYYVIVAHFNGIDVATCFIMLLPLSLTRLMLPHVLLCYCRSL